MAAQVGADLDFRAGRRLKAKMRVKTGDAVYLKKWHFEAFSKLRQRLPRQVPVTVLQALKLLDQHGILASVVTRSTNAVPDGQPLCRMMISMKNLPQFA
jgi:hypothetical protein